MTNKHPDIGFTPLDKDEVMNSIPKLNELFKIKNTDVFFKNPENNFIQSQSDGKRVQGSLVMPDSRSAIDFEIITDFLMHSTTIALATRDLLESNKFGVTDQDFSILKDLKLETVKNIFKQSLLDAPRQTAIKQNDDIVVAQKNIDSFTNTMNNKISIQQNSNNYTSPRQR